MYHHNTSQHLQKVATARHLTILDTKPHLGTRLCQLSCKTQMANFRHSAAFRIAKCQGNLVHPLAQTFDMWKVKLWNTTDISHFRKKKKLPVTQKSVSLIHGNLSARNQLNQSDSTALCTSWYAYPISQPWQRTS